MMHAAGAFILNILQTSPTKKNGESTLICNRRTFRGTKCKPAGSTTADPAKEKCCSSSIVSSVAIDNLPDVLSNKCQLKSVTMAPHELIAVSPDIASGSCSDPNAFYDSTQVHIDCNTSSRDFEHSCLLKVIQFQSNILTHKSQLATLLLFKFIAWYSSIPLGLLTRKISFILRMLIYIMEGLTLSKQPTLQCPLTSV